jgi:hypothetical protein
VGGGCPIYPDRHGRPIINLSNTHKGGEMKVIFQDSNASVKVVLAIACFALALLLPQWGVWLQAQDYNEPPNCDEAVASPNTLWPPDHQFVPIFIIVDDPNGDPVTLTVTSITQDEPVVGPGSGNTAPDGMGVGTNTAEVRAERAGPDNSRVYEIDFTANDGFGGTCFGTVTVVVPHDQGTNTTIVDDGQIYDSTEEP